MRKQILRGHLASAINMLYYCSSRVERFLYSVNINNLTMFGVKE